MAKFTAGVTAALSTVDGFQRKLVDLDNLIHNRVDLIASKSTFQAYVVSVGVVILLLFIGFIFVQCMTHVFKKRAYIFSTLGKMLMVAKALAAA
jgi:hypothetical protein